MDWANEIERKIAHAYESHGAILAADADGMISTALRKAKADGMREAAELSNDEQFWWYDQDRRAEFSTASFIGEIEVRANQIEKGQ